MLTIYLFCLFLVIYGYLFIPDRNKRHSIASPAPIESPELPVIPPVPPETDIDYGSTLEGTSAAYHLPDLNSLSARQLYKLVRQLRQDQGVIIPAYKSLKVSQLREAIVSAVQ